LRVLVRAGTGVHVALKALDNNASMTVYTL